jgi:hypothetical protein
VIILGTYPLGGATSQIEVDDDNMVYVRHGSKDAAFPRMRMTGRHECTTREQAIQRARELFSSDPALQVTWLPTDGNGKSDAKP